MAQQAHRKTNSCPKCQGLLVNEEDIHGPYVKCVACGKVFEFTPPDPTPPPEPFLDENGEPIAKYKGHRAITHTDEDGCEVAPTCLECPLEKCRYDEPGAYQKTIRQRRDQEIVETIKREDLTTRQAAIVFKKTERTIFRIKARHALAQAEIKQKTTTQETRQ